MSGQWEVVSKKRDKTKLPIKITQDAKKQIINENNLKNKGNEKNKENKKPAADNGKNKKNQKKNEKPQESKHKQVKSIESALNSININDLEQVYQKSKTLFPDAPIVWLKELAMYLNQKLNVEINDPVFSNKSVGYPYTIVPPLMKDVIERAVKQAGTGNVQVFFDNSLTAMASDMGKNLHCLGYKLFFQSIVFNRPSIAVSSLSKHKELLNSYQNRPMIGLSIMWALGQAGRKDFQIGLKVLEELMLPLLEMKNYSKYVVKYILYLVSNNKDAHLSNKQYIQLLDIFYGNKKNFPTDLKKETANVRNDLKKLLLNFDDQEKYISCAEYLLKTLTNNHVNNYKYFICDTIIECYKSNRRSMKFWKGFYAKNIGSSAILLQYINMNWKSLAKYFETAEVKETLQAFAAINANAVAKTKNDKDVQLAITALRDVQKKMAKKQKKSSSFPFRTLVYLAVAVGLGIFVYDLRNSGSWNASRTRKFLEETRVIEFTNTAVGYVKIAGANVNGNIKENYPEFHKAVVEFSEPYIELFCGLGVLSVKFGNELKDSILQKIPIILESIESYAPGLVEQSQNVLSNVWSTSVLYVNRSVDYLKTEVFVGQLSPENMQRVVIEAFNTTQRKATEYYHWLYEKVQTSIK